MSSSRNIESLRSILFNQLEALANPDTKVDLERSKVLNETAQLIVNTAKVEVEHSKILKGSLTIPFIEGQQSILERRYVPPVESKPPTAPALSSHAHHVNSRNIDHPWRGLGSRS